MTWVYARRVKSYCRSPKATLSYCQELLSMADTPVNHKRAIPAAFDQYRRKMFERPVRLTEEAIAELEANGQTVTLSCICEVTRDLDEQDKGLRPTTILRNPQAAE